MKPLGIAVIGTGRLGRVYARAVAAMTEARLVAVADVDAEARRLGEALGDYVPAFPERFGDAYASDLRAFVSAVMHDRPVSPTGEDGLAAVNIAVAATSSAHQGGAPVAVLAG